MTRYIREWTFRVDGLDDVITVEANCYSRAVHLARIALDREYIEPVSRWTLTLIGA